MNELIEPVLDSVRRLFDDELSTASSTVLCAQLERRAHFAAQLRDLGWTMLTRPQASGGLGVPLAATIPLLQLGGEYLAPGPLAEGLLAEALLSMPEGATPAIVDAGVTEDWRASIGGLSSKDEVIDGQVRLVRHALEASHLVLVCDEAEPTVAVVEAATTHIAAKPLDSTDPCASYASVSVTQLPLSACVLAIRGAQAASLILALRAWSRLFAASELSGISRRLVRQSVGYVKERRQFDRPIGSFQALKHILAEMAKDEAALAALCEISADDMETAGRAGLELSGWTAKAFAARAARGVAEGALQAHGGIGFTQEYDLHWFLRRAYALRTWYGDEAELTPLIGRTALAGHEAAA